MNARLGIPELSSSNPSMLLPKADHCSAPESSKFHACVWTPPKPLLAQLRDASQTAGGVPSGRSGEHGIGAFGVLPHPGFCLCATNKHITPCLDVFLSCSSFPSFFPVFFSSFLSYFLSSFSSYPFSSIFLFHFLLFSLFFHFFFRPFISFFCFLYLSFFPLSSFFFLTSLVLFLRSFILPFFLSFSLFFLLSPFYFPHEIKRHLGATPSHRATAQVKN